MSEGGTEEPAAIRAGMRVWIPCEVKPGPFSDERLVRVEREGGHWLGFVPDAVLREPIASGRTAVQGLVDEVQRGRVRAFLPGAAVTPGGFVGPAERVVPFAARGRDGSGAVRRAVPRGVG
jgi:hypothetical protein